MKILLNSGNIEVFNPVEDYGYSYGDGSGHGKGFYGIPARNGGYGYGLGYGLGDGYVKKLINHEDFT